MIKLASRLVTASLIAVACSGAPATTAGPVRTQTPPTQAPATASPTAIAVTAPPATARPPASPAGTPQPPGTAGDKLQLGDYQYVTMVDAEWSENGYNEILQPAEGNVVYAFLMEFEGLDPDGSSYGPLYFTLTAGGAQHRPSFIGKEPMLGSGQLQPGETAQGWLSIEAPLVSVVTLRYEPALGFAGQPAEWIVTVNE